MRVADSGYGVLSRGPSVDGRIRVVFLNLRLSTEFQFHPANHRLPAINFSLTTRSLLPESTFQIELKNTYWLD
jgi:hypothetical protein